MPIDYGSNNVATSGNISVSGVVTATSGNFTNLLVNGTGVSASGHTHSSSDITDFVSASSGVVEDALSTIVVGQSGVSVVYNSGNDTLVISASGLNSSYIIDFSSSVSGLLPTIANSGDNRLLTSDGTSTGINAESNLIFDTQNIGTVLSVIHEETESESASSSFLRLRTYTNNSGGAPRIQLDNIRGTQVSPLPIENNDILGVIRWFVPNSSGVLSNSARILVTSQGIASGENNFVPTKMSFNTSSGPNFNDNVLEINSDGSITTSCSLTVQNGLSAPTKIHNLGAVSGNVSISYAIDKQIQTLSLNGTNTNFIEGSSWPSATSVDVLLEITVNTTTSVTWTVVDDFYNPVPATLLTGKYLVLLRSIGTTIQGHYIGEKTN